MVYTDGAAKAKGGEAGVKALAGLGIGNVNTAMKNSGINASAAMAGAATKWNHTSSGNVIVDINALEKDKAIATLRDQNKADLVAALVQEGAASPGGGKTGGQFAASSRGTCALGCQT